MIKQNDIKHKINKLQSQHHNLDAEIANQGLKAIPNQLAIQRLKREKLEIKDKIAKAQSGLIPDIIA